MMKKITSPLIIKANTKKLAAMVECRILELSRNFLKYRNPVKRKNIEGTVLYDV
jgi:hypothetical protein